jgi:hypothetical protein
VRFEVRLFEMGGGFILIDFKRSRVRRMGLHAAIFFLSSSYCQRNYAGLYSLARVQR